MIHNLDEPEDMNGLSVAAAGEEGPAGGEGEGEDGGRSLQSASQLVQLRSVVARENPVRGKYKARTALHVARENTVRGKF